MMNFTALFSRGAHKISVSGLAIILALGLELYFSGPLQAQLGVAPTAVPAGGCAIDGNLLSRIPTTSPFTSDNGDFLPNDSAPGTGGYVFTLAGVPVDTSMAFHIIDGYDNDDATIFTGGSKFNNDPNSWSWITGKPPAKDDINNVLFFFSSDSLGNLWFVGSGDRQSTNGNTYLDFELLQNSLYKNTDGTFTSLGPDGGRTMGDLAVTISYTNGGSNPQLSVYQWDSTGQGNFGYSVVTPAPGTTLLATNKDSAIVVPYGAFGSTIYPASAFTEVACNLNGLISGSGSCLNIKTVIVKTKASQSFNAALKDFIDPVQINIGSAPVVSVNSPTICSGDSAILTATVVSGGGPFSYLWSTSETTQSITVSPDSTTQYTVVVTGGNGCQSNIATSTVTVNAGPVCFISGPDSICPSGSGQFSAPDSLNSYVWTISGNGTIQGDSLNQVVEVLGNGTCNSSFTLNLVVTGATGCTSTCSKTINLEDHISPVISNVPGLVTVQCASQVPPAASDTTVTATDNCTGQVTLTVSDSVTDQTCPNKFTVIRTWTASDLCGNSSTASQTIIVSDTLPPVLEGVPADTVVCCADSIPLPALVTAFDSCTGQVSVTLTEAISDSTGPGQFKLTRTWSAMDSCSNIAIASQVITVNDTLSINGKPYFIGSIGNVVINFKVTPNPFIDNAKIKFTVREDVYTSVELYNSMGVKLRTMYSGNVSSGTNVALHLSPDVYMEPGLYLIVVKTNKGTATRLVIMSR